jgi:membrane protease YdiL (CAAX protease family)
MSHKKESKEESKAASNTKRVKTASAKEKGAIAEFKKKLDKKSKQSKGWSIAIKAFWVFVFTLWVAAVLYATQYLMAFLIVSVFRVDTSILSSNAIQAAYSVVVYALALAITIFVPWKIAHCKTTRDELGLRGLPTWTDLLMAPIGFIVFMIVAVILMAAMQKILPGINWEQEQDVGFNNIIASSDFFLAFICLVILAPVAEEIIFRGWLYGKIRAHVSAIPAMIVVSLLFGIVHGQWNVGVTVFVMSLAMCTMRELTGTIWGGILVHMIKNGIAFYMLYVNPMMIQ